MIRTDAKPIDHFVGHWEKDKKYKLYEVVENNGTTFRAVTAKPKGEPYAIYDSESGTFSANEGWEIVELSADSMVSAGANVSEEDLETALEEYTKSADLATVATSGSYADLSNIPTDIVKASSQSFTDAQKTQARANIGAASETEVAALADQKFAGPYVDGELPSASADTMGAIYLVGPDEDDEYERFVTRLVSDSYTWVSLGTTAVDLTNYATVSEVSQLEAEVDGLAQIKAAAEIGGWDITADDYYRVDNLQRVSLGEFEMKAGDKIVLSNYSACRMYVGWKSFAGVHGKDGWKTSDFTASVDGMYVVTLDSVPAHNLDNKEELTQYFSIIRADNQTELNRENIAELSENKVDMSLGANILPSDMPFLDSTLLSNTGGILAHSSYSAYKTTQDFLRVKPSTTYSRSSEGYQYKKVCYYDKSKRCLSYSSDVNTFTTPATCAFVRISFYKAYGNDMVAEGNTQKPYEKYAPIYGYVKDDFQAVEDLIYDNNSSSFPTRWGMVKSLKNAVSAYPITGAELVTGHKYRVRIVTSPTLTAPSTMTVKVSSADSDTSLANVAQLGGETISDTSVEFVWELASGKNYRLGFYSGAVSQALSVYLADVTVNDVLQNSGWNIITKNRHKEVALVSTVTHLGNEVIKVAGKLSLLHFSDLHGNQPNLKNVVMFRDFYEDFLDDTIHTGDSVANYYTDTDPFQVVDGAETILNVIGNHEAWIQGDTDYNATEKQTYDKIFAPSIANWDVEQPADAATNGYCYYYKDYDTAGFRLIVLDSVHWHYRNGVSQQNAAQKSWFESVLADAITNGLKVVCAIHYTPQNGIVPVENTGFNKYGTTAGGTIADGWYSVDEIYDCVDDFIDNGGKFAGWICGHAHEDYFGTVYGHARQPIVIVGTAGAVSVSNKFISGTASQDNFNVITFEYISDTLFIKVVRIGQDTDIYMRSKKTIAYNFTNGLLLYTN